MIRGGKIFLLSGSLAAAGCTATQDVKVRPLADPAAKFRYGGSLLEQGRAQLSLGNAGLALETFRRLQREQPGADAFAGIAACYAAMGRFDVARANYEFALAYAPSDPALLNALAASLDRLGEGEQATQVRAEAARLAAAPVVSAPAIQAVATPLAVPRLSSVTVKLPAAARPPTEVREQVVAIARPQLAAAAVSLPAARPALLNRPSLISSAEISIEAPEEVVPAGVKQEAIAKPQLARAAVSLPAAHPAVLGRPALNAVEISIPALIETPQVVAAAAPPRRAPMPDDKQREVLAAQVAVRTEGPHMERLSSGEVSLITKPDPVWVAQSSPRKSQPQTPPRTARAVAVLNLAQARAAARSVASAVRWVPLRYASAPTNVQILNAARSQGLAARSRVALLSRGWRKIGIGNARTVRQRSVVLYSPARATIARRLAAHFGCKAIKVEGVQNVVVLLGRDAAFPRPASRA